MDVTLAYVLRTNTKWFDEIIRKYYPSVPHQRIKLEKRRIENKIEVYVYPEYKINPILRKNEDGKIELILPNLLFPVMGTYDPTKDIIIISEAIIKSCKRYIENGKTKKARIVLTTTLEHELKHAISYHGGHAIAIISTNYDLDPFLVYSVFENIVKLFGSELYGIYLPLNLIIDVFIKDIKRRCKIEEYKLRWFREDAETILRNVKIDQNDPLIRRKAREIAYKILDRLCNR